MTSAIQNDTIELIHLETGLGTNTIQLESDFVKDLGMDSIDVNGLIGSLETHFHIKLSQADIIDINTVGELIKLIESKVS
mgnify:CR=1 FL=1|tara:strand:- start:130 stop:369 length:240 start_codon:yes stop_codon:yes gene_type:complete